jgi:hypothetical protein
VGLALLSSQDQFKKGIFMRIVSLLIAFCFSLNVMASTGTIQELERSLDDYHYSLNVEWDQKDQKFYDSKTKEFFDKLETLIKEEGLSQKEIINLVERKVNNKTLVESMKLKLSLMGKATSSEELARMVQESTKDMYAQGASWNGEVIVPVVIGLLVAAAVAYSIWWNSNHECVQTESQYVCTNYNNCGVMAGTTGVYDPYYTGPTFGTQCNGLGYTTCGYADVCTEYAKK